jgi:hypothetical protein
MCHIKQNFAAALCLLTVGAALFAPPANASDDAVQAALEKANAYIEFAKTSERALDSWDRYREWVNLKTGPTGKERYIEYGLYDVPVYDGQIEEVRAAAGKPPLVTGLDAAVQTFLESYVAAAPVINEAAAYYDNKGYEADDAAKGQELHKKLVALFPALVKERAAMMPALRGFARDVEGQELAALETRDGKSTAWHAGALLHSANRVLDFFARLRPEPMTSEQLDEQLSQIGPETSGEKFEELMFGKVNVADIKIDVEGLGKALSLYGEQVAAFETFAAGKTVDPEALDEIEEIKPLPKKLLDLLTELHAGLVKSGGKDFEGGGQINQQAVMTYFELFNNANGLTRSQLRYLP